MRSRRRICVNTINQDQPDVFQPREAALPSGPDRKWRFPAGAVSVLDAYELSRLAHPNDTFLIKA
jgi:hypothetical protein